MNKKQQAAIGIDIGGTKIAGAVVRWPSGKIAKKTLISTSPERGGHAILEDVLTVARDLKSWATSKGFRVAGIGAGIAELVDLEGNVVSHQTIDWRRTPVQSLLSKIAPARVESDVRSAAIAEATFGAGKGRRVVVYITVGTGISYCLLQDGKPFLGAQGNAITMASSPLTTTCEHCGSRLRPVLEEFASGPAIARRYSRLLRPRSKSPAITCVEIFRKAREGDRAAQQILESAGYSLGVNTAFLVNILDPELVVIGGGVGLAGGIYWRNLLKACREHIYADNARAIPIVRAKLGVDAGIVGAAVSVFTMKRN